MSNFSKLKYFSTMENSEQSTDEIRALLVEANDRIDAVYNQGLDEMNLILSEVNLLKSEYGSVISDSDRKEFIKSLNSEQFKFFSRFAKHKKALRLLLDAKSIQYKMLEIKKLQNDELCDISLMAMQKEYEIDQQIVTHETLLEKETNDISKRARFAAFKKHEPKNNAKKEIIKIWASGKYSSKDLCAEQECAGLGLSFSTSRKALRNQ